jgi:hypothetical protein
MLFSPGFQSNRTTPVEGLVVFRPVGALIWVEHAGVWTVDDWLVAAVVVFQA